MTLPRRYTLPYRSVLAGIAAALLNLGAAAWQWARGERLLFWVGIFCAALVIYTTVRTLFAWRDLERARRRYHDALLRQAEQERN